MIKFAVLCLALFHTALAVTHTVLVGGGGLLTFNPTTVIAAEGDIIAYQFRGGTHTVTQATFDDPCTAAPNPYVDSGLVTIDEDVGKYRTFRVVVQNASEPLWIMCGIPEHCMAGMVMVVNPTAEKTFDAFKSTALGLNATLYNTNAALSSVSLSHTLAVVASGVFGVFMAGLVV
ncbi:hypothetical protein AURDEDRAFT_110212 [Auricularia subglabra TFB-10046 SS5]|nr:hypothetical protein AURDEDRAFT_110212 [Auricularia subglabra TFB-10046 SS5]